MAEARSGWSIRRWWWPCDGGMIRRRWRTVAVVVKRRMTLQLSGGGRGRGWGCLERHRRWMAAELVSVGDQKWRRRRFARRVGSGRREVVAGGLSDLTRGGSDEGVSPWVFRSAKRGETGGGSCGWNPGAEEDGGEAGVVKGVRRRWGLLRAAGSRGFGNAGQRGKKVGGMGFGAGGDGEAGKGRGDGMSSSGDGDIEEMGKIDPRGEARQRRWFRASGEVGLGNSGDGKKRFGDEVSWGSGEQ